MGKKEQIDPAPQKNLFQVDAALARPVSPDAIDPSIIGIGMIKGLAIPEIGCSVQKSGRSSGYTRGRITVVGATVTVGFINGRNARFTNQILSAKMGKPGDSGSLLLDGANRAVGLLFAGSATTTIYNPIEEVLQSLQIRLSEDDSLEIPSPEFRSQRKVCDNVADYILALPHVVGVGIGNKFSEGLDTGIRCLTVLVKSKIPRDDLREEDTVPVFMEGLPTDVVESGSITADTTNWLEPRMGRKTKIRPARPGISIGHYRISSGTFGAIAYDLATGEPFILSNNHVIANSTDGQDGLSKIGDPILQPGKSDGGTDPDDVLATLCRISPLRFI